MTIYRKWFCTCSGQRVELNYNQVLEEEEGGEPYCERCGATPSSDPRRTIIYRDVEEWDD
jgi:hypothetical protein